MISKKLAAASTVLLVATAAAACAHDGAGAKDSPVAFEQIKGDRFTANPGAFQTDGVPVPPQGVTMVGDPIAMQAVSNAGLPAGTVTSTNRNRTVYYPPMPAMRIQGLSATPSKATPAPLARPADYRPWSYTDEQLRIYRGICDTGRWMSYIPSPAEQSQVCWGLYGRQLGVAPWMPGQPRPWQQPDYPKPYFDPGFRADVPVMWVYPRDWRGPKPQPIVTVSITLNLADNPYKHPNPKHPDAYYPVWQVMPGTVIDQRRQDQIVAPVYRTTTTTTTVTTTSSTILLSGPIVAPGVVLPHRPASRDIAPVLAVPGDNSIGNPNTDRSLTTPAPAALRGAVIRAGSVEQLDAAIGTSVSASVVTSPEETTTTTTTTDPTSTTSPTGTTTTTTRAADGSTTTTTTTTEVTSTSSSTTTTTTTTVTTTPPTTSERTTEPTQSTTPPTTTTTTVVTTTTTEPPVTTTTTTPPTTTTTTVTTTVPVSTTTAEVTTSAPAPVVTTEPPVVTTSVVPTTTTPPL